MTKSNKKSVKKDINKKPSKDDKKKIFTKSYDLSGSKRVWPSYFNETKYVHLKDIFKQKNLSLTMNEAKLLLKYLPKLDRVASRLEEQAIADGKTNCTSGSDTSHSDTDSE